MQKTNSSELAGKPPHLTRAITSSFSSVDNEFDIIYGQKQT